MTSGKTSTDKMTDDAWLHVLRSEPSPLFKAQLRERLRDHPDGEQGQQHPQRRPVNGLGS